MQIDLNIIMSKLVTHVQQKFVGIHTQNSAYSTTTTTHYKYKVITDGECLHATIKDIDQFI